MKGLEAQYNARGGAILAHDLAIIKIDTSRMFGRAEKLRLHLML
jgi:hypothetical protein